MIYDMTELASNVNNCLKLYPYVNFGAVVLLSLEQLRRSIRRTATVRTEQSAGLEHVTEAKV